jgi:2-isopropylmalate synthase
VSQPGSHGDPEPLPAVQIYDTTLRDGTQTEGVSLSCVDKLRIARRLDRFGVTFIEGGWPGSNPKDVEFFQRAADEPWQHALIAAFGATRRRDVAPEEDVNLRALLAVRAPVCTLVGKTWTLHVREVLRASLDENLAMIEDSVAFLRAAGRRVIYDAEHFFDGHAADPVYALETLRAAIRGGAETLVLCDTNGGSLPWQVEQVVRAVAAATGHPLGIHCHDDTGCGVANSLAAVRGGAVQVQGTINGYGERCGNANLCTVIPDLLLKLGRSCVSPPALGELYELSHYVAEVANVAPDEQMPYVGRSAFAHKGGIHVAAMRRSADSYQHIAPELVGNRMRVVVSELSGRGNLLSKAEELGVEVGDVAEVEEVLGTIKALEAEGFSFEAAEASVALLLLRREPDYRAPFELVDYTVVVEHRQGRGTFAEATVKVEVDGVRYHTAAEGDGPVHALDAALRKALSPLFPQVAGFQLADYKVRILDGASATAATTRVLIDTRAGDHHWSTVGASSNIIEASWRALADSFEYGLRGAASGRPADAAASGAPAAAAAGTGGAGTGGAGPGAVAPAGARRSRAAS